MKNIQTVNPTVSDLCARYDNLLSSDTLRYIRKLNAPGRYLVSRHAMRLDMISMELYNTFEYDWILGLVNGLKNEEIKINSVIKYPDLSELKKFLVKYGSQ